MFPLLKKSTEALSSLEKFTHRDGRGFVLIFKEFYEILVPQVLLGIA